MAEQTGRAGAEKTVAFTFDGEPVTGRLGEPLAVALVRAGYINLARSPKFHRPRGPSCLRGGCDGCVLRVDGVPNVLSCLEPVCDGVRVESQNSALTRRFDPLRGADFTFPNGFNHHDFLAGIPIAEDLLAAFARKVAGLGHLPTEPGSVREATVETTDVLVVGSGPFGLAAARAAASAGLQSIVVDDAVAPGGVLRAFPARDPRAAYLHPTPKDLRVGATVVGIYDPDGKPRALLLARDRGASLIYPKWFVFATGNHDATIPCGDEDRPGVFSARAAGILVEAGVVLQEPVLVAPRGATELGRSVAERLGITVIEKGVSEVLGLSEVRGVSFEDGTTLSAKTLIVDVPPAPAHELLAEAGFAVVLGEAGFLPAENSLVSRRNCFLAIGGANGRALGEVAATEAALDRIFSEASVVDEGAEEKNSPGDGEHIKHTK